MSLEKIKKELFKNSKVKKALVGLYLLYKTFKGNKKEIELENIELKSKKNFSLDDFEDSELAIYTKFLKEIKRK